MAAPIPPETEPAHPRRRSPLQGPGHADVVAPAPPPAPPPEPPGRAPLGRAALVGVVVALGVTALAYGLAAGPIYMLAQISPDGLDRPAFRNAFVAALVAGALLGTVAGVAAAVWSRRGGHLPTDRTPFLDR